MNVTVVVATYGTRGPFEDLAQNRAVPSAEVQAPAIHVHLPGGTLAEARNEGLRQVETEFVIHLDADDELEPGYVEAMAKGTADVRVPAVHRIWHGARPAHIPKVWGHTHDCTAECLRYGNWIVVGACVRTELVRDIGWEEFGWSEDWGLWARCYRAGASFERIPEAVYRAYHSRTGRNRVRREVALRWHREIEAAVWPDEPSVL